MFGGSGNGRFGNEQQNNHNNNNISISANAAPPAEPASGNIDDNTSHLGNGNNKSNGDYEHIDHGGVQGLTVEEEMREFNALSADEMVAVQADLIGLSGAMGALHIGQETNIMNAEAEAGEEHGHKRARAASSSSLSASIPPSQQQTQNPQQFGQMAEELGRLPSEETAACRRALEACPDQVLDPRRIQMFLDYATEEERMAQYAQRNARNANGGSGSGGGTSLLFGNHNISGGGGEGGGGTSVQALVVQRAASQLARYWKVREHMFNGAHPDTAFLPMTQVGALTPAGASLLTTRRIWQLLPQTDTSGRSIVYFVPGRKNYSEHSFYEELAGLWYLIETVMEDPDRRRCGVVMLMDLRGYTRQHTSRGAFSGLTDLTSALPISCFKAVHACYPSSLVNHVIFPIIKRLSPREIRLRTVLHHGSVNEVLTSLSGYCLPPECVPTDLGGQLVVDSPSWMLSRLAAETPQVDPSIGTAVQNDIEASNNVPIPVTTVGTDDVAEAAAAATSKRDDNNDGSSNGDRDDTVAPNSDHHPNLSDRQLYERIMVKKEEKLGKKGDPRMNRTLLICVEDPDLPHLDALLQCGFDFSPSSREELELRSSRAVKDVENITLKQRLDQLSRRLRTARKWIKREREEGKLRSEPTSSATGEFRSGTADSGNSNTSGDASEGSGKHNRSSVEKCTLAEDADDEIQQNRRDSFDEAIEELPGIDNLGDTIGEMMSDEER